MMKVISPLDLLTLEIKIYPMLSVYSVRFYPMLFSTSKLQRHLETKHAVYKGKDISFFNSILIHLNIINLQHLISQYR